MISALNSESKQKYIKGIRKSIRTYKINYDTCFWNILHCKIIHHQIHYFNNFVEYTKNFMKYDKYIKKIVPSKKMFS